MKLTSELSEVTADRMAPPAPAPTFLVKLDPWHRVFFRNLTDFFWRRRPPALAVSSRPGAFWPDVFVSSHLPWKRFAQSASCHAVVILMLWGLGQLWPQQQRVMDRAVFRSADVIYYSPSEYLLPINTGVRQAERPLRGEPEYSPQPIISVPPEPDNHSQTIVTPPDAKLNHDVSLPNIVAWSGVQPTVPLAATSGTRVEMNLPALPASVVTPPPELNAASMARTMQGPSPAIVGPPPTVDATSDRKWGEMNIGHSAVVAPAPQLPLAEQRVLNPVTQSTLAGSGRAVVPPPPSIGGGLAANGGGRIIALSIHPALLSAPVDVPQGNRRGTFAATPEGKPGAAGTPNLVADASSGSGNGGGSGNNTKGVPPGLYVGSSSGHASSAAGRASGNGTSTATQPSGDPGLLAEAAPPRVTSTAQRPLSEISGSATEIERKVFGDRRFYSMTLNMPNLNSAGGSWVIRFAELHDNHDRGDLVAPLATQKVDPAYPLELMRHGVQGTVTLYAVIRSDGSVSEVRVLRGVDDRLDEYARTALSRWHFHPATKNGAAVDLEAVIMIPFKTVRAKPGF
jgi:TonB family protein